MASFKLKILSCDRLFYQGECDALIYPAADGGTEILANHTQMTAQVCVGELRYKIPSDPDWKIAVVSGGIVEVGHNDVTVIVYSAEKPEEIDAERARKAKELAEAEMREKQSAVNQRISEDSFNRAVQRIKSAGR